LGNDLDIVEAEREANNKAAAAAIVRFEQAAKGSGISSESRVVEASYSGAGLVFGELARSFDLAVINQAGADSISGNMIIEGALFDSGRPVLVVPYIQTAGLKLDRVTVCWDGSRSAARATNDAMPFFARAKAIDVVTVTGEKSKVDALEGADIAHHLARHGAKVDLRTIAVGDSDVANVVLSDAADRSTDLIVMGGYGHSRFREFVLGGATRGMLQSMTVPILMSH
jgi:nucleotide-binding universal stress UspA family protein